MAVLQGTTSSSVVKTMTAPGEARANFVITNNEVTPVIINLYSLGTQVQTRIAPKNLEVKPGKTIEIKDIVFVSSFSFDLSTNGSVDYYVWTTVAQSGQSFFNESSITVTGGGAGSLVVNETPTGAVNGSNVDFSSAFDFIPESVAVNINGFNLAPVVDFITIGTTSIQLTDSPLTGEIILISYIKQ